MNSYKHHIQKWANNDTFTWTVTFHLCGDHHKTAQLFVDRVNEKVFGNVAAKRFKRSLSVLAVRQKDPDHGGYHVHFALGGFPDNCDAAHALTYVANKLQKVWGVDIGPITDEKEWFGRKGQDGWLSYMTRLFGSQRRYSRPAA